MSQKPSASHPASRSPSDGRSITLPPVQLHHDPELAARQAGAEGRLERGSQQVDASATAQPAQGFTEDDRALPRDLGVHTMLNPTEPESAQRISSQPPGALTLSPRLLAPASQLPPPPSMTIASSGYGGQKPTSPRRPSEGPISLPSMPRKILIPKSPRTISLGGRSVSTALINAQETPFLGERSHSFPSQQALAAAAEMQQITPGSGGPPPPYGGFPPPPPSTTPTLGRRASVATMGGPSRPGLSQSASPTPSFSSYTGPGQQSPASRYQTGHGLPPATSYFPGSSLSAPLRVSSPSQTAPPTEGPYMTPLPESMFYRGSPGGTHSSAIRMMPISTEHGPVFMPVDVQAASKVADEKRARNAGASARFRQRRKEKEREANTSIQRLEQQKGDLERKLKDVEQERDFYRTERDRFREIVYRTPSTREYAMQAPQSPRAGRSTGLPPPPPPPPPGPGPGASFQGPDPGASVEQERAPRRRRTDTVGDYTYQMPSQASQPPPPHPNLPVVSNPPFSRAPGSAQSPPNLPPLRLENLTGPPSTGAGVTPNQPGPASAPPPFQPYPQRSPHDRPWPGGRSGYKSASEGGQRP